MLFATLYLRRSHYTTKCTFKKTMTDAEKWVQETTRKADVFKKAHTDLYRAYLPIKQLADLVQEYKTYEWHIWDNELFAANRPQGLGLMLDARMMFLNDARLVGWFAYLNRGLLPEDKLGFRFFSIMYPTCNRSLCYGCSCICGEPLRKKGIVLQ